MSEAGTSAVDLLKLVKTFVLADLYDLQHGQVSWWQLMNPAVSVRVLVAKLAEMAFGDAMQKAAERSPPTFVQTAGHRSIGRQPLCPP